MEILTVKENGKSDSATTGVATVEILAVRENGKMKAFIYFSQINTEAVNI